MTTPPHRPGPHGPQPGGHGEQPTQPLRPLSGQQPYGQRQPYAQQPPPREHSGDQPPHRPRHDRTAVLTGVVAVLALLLAGAGVLVLTDDDKATSTPSTRAPSSAPPTGGTGNSGPGEAVDARVGDCIKVEDASTTDAEVSTIDCADPQAAYRVGIREEDSVGRCPSENYVSYTEEGSLRLCLMLNARPGDCFHETELQDTRVACDSPKASYEVGEIFAGTADANRCGEANAFNALTYPEPPLTICRLSTE